jgi:hypothetical protein
MVSRRRLLQSADPGVLATNASLGSILAAAAAALAAPNTTSVVAGITPPLDLLSATFASMDALVATLSHRVNALSTAVDALADSYDVSFADRDAWALSTGTTFQIGLEDAIALHGDLESAAADLLAKLRETFSMNTATSGTLAAAQLDLLGDLLEIEGEQSFRIAAYRRAAIHVRETATSIAQLALDGRCRPERLAALSGTYRFPLSIFVPEGNHL